MSIVLWVQVYTFRSKLNTRIIYFKSIPSFLELKRSFFSPLNFTYFGIPASPVNSSFKGQNLAARFFIVSCLIYLVQCNPMKLLCFRKKEKSPEFSPSLNHGKPAGQIIKISKNLSDYRKNTLLNLEPMTSATCLVSLLRDLSFSF